MRKRLQVLTALGAMGLLAGIVISSAVPGRFTPDALAELYHGPTDTTGQVHFAIDCDLGVPGTQSSCTLVPGTTTVTVGVTVANSTGSPLTANAFGLEVTTDQTVLDPEVVADENVNGNPDANQALFANLSCDPPGATADSNPDPSIALSSLYCFDVTSGPVLPANPDTHVLLATITYDIVGGNGSPVVLELSYADVYEEATGQYFDCAGAMTPALCFDAEIIGAAACGPAGPNNDGNFIDNGPSHLHDDLTRANSDTVPDACDSDDDNDGIADLAEPCCGLLPVTCPPGSSSLNPLDEDTDGDRYLDLVECILDGHPFWSSTTPPISTCGATSDADGDGLADRIEFCFYGTSPTVADSDGDGVKDGCEASSFNTDTVVNSIDQGMFALERTRTTPPARNPNFDINKDGVLNSIDQGIQAGRFGKCP
jgi:hypothetical protein